MLLLRAQHIFKICKNNLKFLGTRKVTWSKAHSEDPQILCAKVLFRPDELAPWISEAFFFVTQEPNSGLSRLIVEVSRSHTIRHTQPVGFLWRSNQAVAEAATYTTQTNARDENPCPQQDSNSRSQQPSGFRPTPETALPPGWALFRLFLSFFLWLDSP
jgi:hypothetical protein